jgi:hypothetical protein
MNTLFLLMAQYDGQAVIPLDRVCVDYMNLTVEKFKRKRLDGEIDVPVVRLGADSQKAGLGIHMRPCRLHRQTARKGFEGTESIDGPSSLS